MFGELRAFHLLADQNELGKSKGVAFLEYFDPTMTDIAIAGLSGLEVKGVGRHWRGWAGQERGGVYW